jgi:hypothetical protein
LKQRKSPGDNRALGGFILSGQNAGLLIIGSALLSGCVTAGGGALPYESELRTYVECNFVASHTVARQAGDPLSLAIAARAMCSKEELSLERAIISHRGYSIAARAMENFRQTSVEQNAATIVNARMGPRPSPASVVAPAKPSTI